MIKRISNIEYRDNIIVQRAGKYDADIIIGAIIKMIKGLNIPPVRYIKATNWVISNNKNRNVFL